jgi:hypothetical protein
VLLPNTRRTGHLNGSFTTAKMAARADVHLTRGQHARRCPDFGDIAARLDALESNIPAESVT